MKTLLVIVVIALILAFVFGKWRPGRRGPRV